MALLRALLTILALTHLVLGGLAARSVLCIEPDGRISIEHAGLACCDSSDGDEDHGLSMSEAGCCPCVDIAIPGDLDRSTAHAAPPLELELVALVADLELAVLSSEGPAERTLEPTRGSAGPPRRSSTVRRC